MKCHAKPPYPRPAGCHPETCTEFSVWVTLVHLTHAERYPLLVECDYCATVIGLFTDRDEAARIATSHAAGHEATVPSSGRGERTPS